MKTRYLLPLLALVAGTSFAAPRTLQQARDIAQQAFVQRLKLGQSDLGEAVMRAPQRPQADRSESSFTPYYVFTDQQSQGFVLVSGSDLMPEVLGYGFSPMPTSDNELPISLRSWLKYVSEVEEYVELHPETASLLQTAQATNTVIPQLMTTEWGQDDPYCDQCPLKNGEQTITGCMATSISQVINYHKYPTQFEGSYSYNDQGTTRSLDFSQISIDYSKMLNNYYREGGSAAQRAEVAKLMKAVGFAINMAYGTSREGGSGAITEMGTRGLIKNLGYTKAQHILRKNYTLDEWNEIIQYELQNQRPVVCDGHSSSGGHSFVLDGVDARGYYHVNWGWDGMSNGYYDISVLHPDQYGAGASESADGFTGSQDLIVGLGNPDQITRWYSPINVDDSNSIRVSSQSVGLGQSLTVSAYVWNNRPTAFKGYAGLLILNAEGEEYQKVESSNYLNISATTLKSTNAGKFTYTSYGTANISRSIILPSNMPEGEYRIYMYIRPEDYEGYDFVRQLQTRPNYWTITVAGNRATLTNPQALLPVSPVSWNFESETLSTQPSQLKVNLTNSSHSSVACSLYAILTRPDGTELEPIPAKKVLTLAPEEETEAVFDVDFTLDGQWSVQLMGQPIGIDIPNLINIASNTFTVELNPTMGARFNITKKLEVLSEKVYNVGPVMFNLQLSNTGAAYHGKIAVRLYSSKTSTASKYLQAEIENEVDFPMLTTQDVQISGTLNLSKLSVAQTTLYARVFYLYDQTMEPLSNAVTNVTIFRKDEAAIHGVSVDEADPEDYSQAVVYDICGRRVNVSGQLPRGIYIINGQKRIIR